MLFGIQCDRKRKNARQLDIDPLEDIKSSERDDSECDRMVLSLFGCEIHVRERENVCVSLIQIR